MYYSTCFEQKVLKNFNLDVCSSEFSHLWNPFYSESQNCHIFDWKDVAALVNLTTEIRY